MAANVAEIIIKAIDQATGPLKQIGGQADQLGQSFTKAGAAMAVAGGAILGAFGMMVARADEYGSALNEASIKTGITSEKLAGLKFAAEQSGATLENVTSAMKFMSKAVVETERGTLTYVEAMRDLGITIEEVRGLSQEELFNRIADSMQGAGSDARKLAAATVVLGRGAQQLLPMFENGAEGLRRFQKQAEAMGVALSSKTAQGLDDMGDAMAGAKTAIWALGLQIGIALAPMVKSIADAVSSFVKQMAAFQQAHPAVYAAVVELTAALGAFLAVAGPVIIVLGQLKIAMSALALTGGVAGAFAKVAAVWQSLVTIATAVGAAIGASAGFIVVAIAAILAFVKILGDQIVYAINHWELFKLEVRAFGEELWALITGPFVKLWDSIAYMSQLGKNLILALWEGMKSVLTGFWNWLDATLVGPLREVGRQMMTWSGGSVGGGMANWRLPGARGAGAGAQVQVYVDGQKTVDRYATGLSKVMVGG